MSKNKILFGILAAIIISFVGCSGTKSSSVSASSSHDYVSSESFDTSSSIPETVTMSEMYKNEEEGFAFSYPTAWKVFNDTELQEFFEKSELKDLIVFLGANRDVPEAASFIEIRKTQATQDLVEQIFFETSSSSFDLELDGVPAKLLIDVDSAVDGEDITLYTRRYFYINGANIYSITFSCMANQAESLERFFNAIMENYKIIPKEDIIVDFQEPSYKSDKNDYLTSSAQENFTIESLLSANFAQIQNWMPGIFEGEVTYEESSIIPDEGPYTIDLWFFVDGIPVITAKTYDVDEGNSKRYVSEIEVHNSQLGLPLDDIFDSDATLSEVEKLASDANLEIDIYKPEDDFKTYAKISYGINKYAILFAYADPDSFAMEVSLFNGRF